MAAQTINHLLPRLKLSLEEKLLLVCARLHLEQCQRDELAALIESPVNWDQLLYKARWHNLTPLVFHHLRSLENRDHIPPEVMGQFKAAYLGNVVVNLHLQAELGRAQEALGAEGVPVILLKGAALARIVYGDIGLRPMSDLDLLVPESQVYVAQKAVRDLGYNEVGTPEEQDDTERHHRHLPGLVREGTPVLVEVHRHIVRRDAGLYFDIAGFWSRAQEISVGRKQALVLAPEDLLIHLALNFFLDRRFRSNAALRQLCDVAESLRFYTNSISWRLFVDNVRVYRLIGPVGCVLYLAQELLNAPVPSYVAQQLWPQGFEALQLERFLRRRVLDTQDWVAHALVAPGVDYKPGRVAATVLQRLFPGRRGLSHRFHRPASGVQGLLMYLSLIGDGTRIFFRSVIRPDQIREDLAIDRWHHSLYGYRSGPDEWE